MLIVILLAFGVSTAGASEFKFVVPVEIGDATRGAILIEAPQKGIKKSKLQAPTQPARRPAAEARPSKAKKELSKKPGARPN